MDRAGRIHAWGMVAQAQLPDKFMNLKVLPKDISKAELQSMMRGFAFALNVRCEHAEKPGGKKFEIDSLGAPVSFLRLGFG